MLSVYHVSESPRVPESPRPTSHVPECPSVQMCESPSLRVSEFRVPESHVSESHVPESHVPESHVPVS